jgi:hypothetical protein
MWEMEREGLKTEPLVWLCKANITRRSLDHAFRKYRFELLATVLLDLYNYTYIFSYFKIIL